MIYIHIGLQKTGTTSLQYYLDKNNLLKFPLDPIKRTKINNELFYSSGNQEFFDIILRVDNLKEYINKKREEIEKIKIEYDINDNDPTVHNNELIHDKSDDG